MPYPHQDYMTPEFVLKSDGRVLKRPIELTVPGEVEINVDGALQAAVQSNVTRQVHGLMKFQGNPVKLSVVAADGRSYLSTRLDTLFLNCTVTTEGKYVVPSFKNAGSFVPLQWKVPGDMRLVFVADIFPESLYATWKTQLGYLFAMRGTVAYRLPLPNLFDDCHICTGNEPGYTESTMFDCFAAILKDFQTSEWNADLLADRTREQENLRELFRFESLESGFSAVAPSVPWEKLCKKIGSAVLEHI